MAGSTTPTPTSPSLRTCGSTRVPERFRDRVPQVERSADGIDEWMLDGEPIYKVGLTATAGWPDPFPGGPSTYEECHPAAYDPHARLQYMDEVGIWAQVLYPNVAGFGGQRSSRPRRRAEDRVRARVQRLPARLGVGRPAPAHHDHGHAVLGRRGRGRGGRALRRGSAHRGILFTGEPQRFGLPVLGEPHWDPLWAVAQDAGLADPLPHRQRRHRGVVHARARRGARRRRRRTRTRRSSCS